MTDKISIIIPTYNRAHLIGETLNSILNQSYVNWECIVVDDGSDDNTAEVLLELISQDNRFIYVERPTNMKKGANSCRNFGLEISNGEYINWFDSDDIMHPDKLKIQLELLLSDGSEMSVSQCVDFEGDVSNITGLKNKSVFEDDAFNAFIQNRMKIFTPSPLFKKDFLVKNNFRFNQDLSRSQEFELFVRILAILPKYSHTNKVLTFVRKHDESISYSKMSVEKILSTYHTRFFLIQDYLNKLDETSVRIIRERMQSIFLFLLNEKEFNSANSIRKDIIDYRGILGNEFAIKINLAFFTFKYFGKGEKILKF